MTNQFAWPSMLTEIANCHRCDQPPTVGRFASFTIIGCTDCDAEVVRHESHTIAVLVWSALQYKQDRDRLRRIIACESVHTCA